MSTHIVRQRRQGRWKKAKWAYVFLLPWFVFFAVFTVYPFFYGIGVSFTNHNLTGAEFIGLENYAALTVDPAFVKSLMATVAYAAMIIPLTIALSLWIANALRRWGGRMNAVSKAIIYMPGVTCQAAMVIVWKFIFSPTGGLSGMLFSALGMPMFSWFDSPATALPVLSIITVMYNLGQPVILYSAAMNGIPASYYEAAELDGASRTRQFFKITLPLLHSITTFILITTTIGIFQIFVVPYLMTGGGPQYTTSSLLLMIYRSAFQNGSFGYASAVGVVLFLITAIIAAFQFRLMRRDAVEY